ncbi:MAG TPA: hypothetical protein OIM17_00720 [Clostridiales bacterium]|nr:hypothetical protein [Clostridiales bacterium]
MDILELQYEMLSRLSSQCGSLNLNDFQLETGESAADIEAAARGLWHHDPQLITVGGAKADTISITSAGRLALAAMNQELDEKAERKKQQSFQNKLSVANILVPFVTFFLGVMVEHWSGLVDLVIRLFH